MNAPFLRRTLAATFAAALVLGGSSRVMAEDIDIFTSATGGVAPPNLLMILDSSSNWSSTLSANACNGASPYGANTSGNTMFAAEVCAIQKIMETVPDNAIRMGLMMISESGNNGAYVRFGMRNMNPQNKQAMKDLVAGFVQNGSGTDNSGSNQPYAKMMYEAFKYYGGYTCPAHATDGVGACSTSTNDQTHFGKTAFAGGPDNSSGSYRRDYPTNNSGPNRAAARYNADNNAAFSSSSATEYSNPIVDVCAKNFVVFVSNGNPGTGGDSSTLPARDTAIMSNISATLTAYPNASNEIHASKMDEMAYYLRHTDVSSLAGQQYVTTYTIAVYVPRSITFAADGVTVTSETFQTSDASMIALMKSAANLGGGKYCAARDASQLLKCILDIVNEVQAVNSVFVSASLPVSVNNQGTFLNQVYMGMFRPDGSGNPRWLGNLKEYKFTLDTLTGSISLADAKSPPDPAVNPGTGFISPAAWSFWTRRGDNPAVAGWPNRDFWIINQSGSPPNGSDALDASHGDGEVVEKGGASEMLRIDFATSQASRRMFTCPLPLTTGCTANAAPPDFDSTLVTGATYQAAFGPTVTAVELPLLVDWFKGSDNFSGTPCDNTVSPCTWSSSELGPGWPATVRPSIHGDVLHSRPVVVNYGPLCPTPLPQPASPVGKCGPWVFYGANDGTLRAVKGGQNNTIAAKDGHESWAFLAPEFFGKVKRQRDKAPELRLARTDPALYPVTSPKDYFFDGPIGIWEDPSSNARWIFVTARRGGALIYAFDVTDPTAPIFKWRKSAADLPNLGQTWSTPFIFKLTGDTDPTLVMGAGYDTGEDATPAVASTTGRGIYVLNANDGSVKNGGDVVAGLMKHGRSQNVDVADSVPSDLSLLVNSSGQVYRGYFGDTGGNVWRLDIPDNNVANWRLFKFATLGAKKFFYAPDVVHAGSYDVVLVGTGDREKPLVNTSSDSFYALNDAQNDPAVVAPSVTALVPGDLVLLSTTTGITSSNGTCTGGLCVCSPPICKGWYRNLSTGEKVVNSPLTVAGTTYFSTNKPIAATPGSCTNNLGEARAYGFSFFGGTPNKTQPDGTMGQPLTGGGLPPSPVGGVVEIAPGQNVAFIIGAGDKGSSVEGGRITIPVASTRRKVYWNQSRDN